jgi:hypothetical protein
METATTKKAAEDIAKALKEIFQKYTLTTRKRAWKGLNTPDGKKIVNDLLIHPTKPTNRIRSLNFKEWTIFREETETQIKTFAKDGQIDIAGLPIKELRRGMQVEREHDGRMGKDTNVTGKDMRKVLKIAVAHLREDPKYYTKLKTIEKD